MYNVYEFELIDIPTVDELKVLQELGELRWDAGEKEEGWDWDKPGELEAAYAEAQYED